MQRSRRKQFQVLTIILSGTLLLSGCSQEMQNLTNTGDPGTLSEYNIDTTNNGNPYTEDPTSEAESTNSSTDSNAESSSSNNDDFKWTSQQIQIAQDVYTATDWTRFTFIGSGMTGSYFRANVSDSVRGCESIIRDIISDHPNLEELSSYTELILAILQVRLGTQEAYTESLGTKTYTEDAFKNKGDEDVNYGYTDSDVYTESASLPVSAGENEADFRASTYAFLVRMNTALHEISDFSLYDEDKLDSLLYTIEFGTALGNGNAEDPTQSDFPYYYQRNQTSFDSVGAAAQTYASQAPVQGNDLSFPGNVVDICTIVRGMDAGGGSAAIVAEANRYVGNPYVWGGESLTDGCDCSHFVWLILKKLGKIPADAPYQTTSDMHSGRLTCWGAQYIGTDPSLLKEGDIIVYSPGNIHHVAFYAGNGKIVEAQGSRAGITNTRSATSSAIADIFRIPSITPA